MLKMESFMEFENIIGDKIKILRIYKPFVLYINWLNIHPMLAKHRLNIQAMLAIKRLNIEAMSAIY